MIINYSVIIPTIGRESLIVTLASILNQTYTPKVVIVVNDNPAADLNFLFNKINSRTSIVLLNTGGGKGGGFARQMGIDQVDTEYVAFCDDDDTWLSEKIEKQFKFLKNQTNLNSVISCSFEFRRKFKKTTLPKKIWENDKNLMNSLIKRHTLRWGQYAIPTSTLFLNTEICRKVKWDTSLKKHQDWDWLCSVSNEGIPIYQLKDKLVEIQQGSFSSVSKEARSHESFAWLQKISKTTYISERSKQDFIIIHCISPNLINAYYKEAIKFLREIKLPISVPATIFMFKSLISGILLKLNLYK